MSIRIQDATAGGYAAGSYDGGPDEPPDLGPPSRRKPPVKVADPGGMSTEEGRERQTAQRLADRLGREAQVIS